MRKSLMRGALVLPACIAMLALGGCGGGSSSPTGSGNADPVSPAGPTDYTIGGTVSGLSAGESVTLLNNGNDALTVSTDGAFTFATPLAAYDDYRITLEYQTSGIMCSIGNASGPVNSANVTDIAVSCAPSTYTVSGTVAGLGSGQSVTLVNEGAQPQTVSANGAFSFAGIAGSSAYDITVQSASGTHCSVINGTGTVGSFDVTGVAVSCNVRTETVLYTFAGSALGGTDGIEPEGELIVDGAGNFYGTTQSGGDGAGADANNGYGTVYEVSAGGTETVLYSFLGGLEGLRPLAGLVRDGGGNLYGTTNGGGTTGEGTVFKIGANGTETILHAFSGYVSDGASPAAGLVMDSAGNLYGTTPVTGEYGSGTVFEVSAAGTESLLHSFGQGTDGQEPEADLLRDSAGNLYGTTDGGGVSGGGTVFEISAAGAETVLHSFGAGTDGKNPVARLIMDGAGNLYGTTNIGGVSGNGTVFEISAAGTETVLYSFAGADGAGPGALVMDSAGNLYGTTAGGGAYGEGTVFELSATGTETILYSFGSEDAGQDPSAGEPNATLLMDGAGNLYGTTPRGGTFGSGTLYRINAN